MRVVNNSKTCNGLGCRVFLPWGLSFIKSEGRCVISGFILSDFLPSENIQFMNEITSLQQIGRDCMELEP